MFAFRYAHLLFLLAVFAPGPARAETFAPDQSRLPVAPPKDAIVLFDGRDTNLFLSKTGGDVNWQIEDGALVSTPGGGNTNHIVSQLHFRDADIHVEFMLPEQGSGNSGVYIHGNYELQIHNSYGEVDLDDGDMGAIYGFQRPLVNACRKPGEWQVYDIRYRAPRRDESGNVVEPGSITAWLNGKKVQENTRFREPRSVYHPFRYGTTDYLKKIWQQQQKTMTGPVFLQDHSNPVKFRNVWVRPRDDHAFHYKPNAEAPTSKTPSDKPLSDRFDNYRDWAIYRGDKKANQYSELDQINTSNVQSLEVAWEYKHGDPEGPSMYSNPIVVNGLLYFTTPKVNAVALDAATGEEVWVFESARHRPGHREFRGRNRGLVYWEDQRGEGRRIFNFVKDQVFAIDAMSGELIESFGDGGAIDLRKNLPVDRSEASVEVTTPGIVYGDVLIVGSRVPEGNNSTPGDIRGYDARTGEFEWIFHTIPHEGETGYETWQWETGEVYGGANPWGGFSLDQERGWVFCATGCAAGDFIYGGTRKGKNLFANCVLALDAVTGRLIWHYQTVHHDIWDYDNPPAPILATIRKDGKPLDVAVQLTKMGLTFVLDRETGKPVFPVEERPVPRSNVPGEEAWPTQPIPTKPPPLVRQATYQADLTNISDEAHEAALEQFRKLKTGPLYTPASLQGTITTPGHQGGAEWGGGAFDPNTGVLYVNVNEAPTINRLEPLATGDIGNAGPELRGALVYKTNCIWCHGSRRTGDPPLYPPLQDLALTEDAIADVLRQGRGIMPSFAHLPDRQIGDLVAYLQTDQEPDASGGGGGSASRQGTPRYAQIAPFFVDHEGYPAISPPWGTLCAVDLQKGEILWKVPLGEYPELARRGIRNTGAKSFGGPVLTAGNLIFIAGTPDEKIRAFDKHTGQVLWEHKLPAGGYATPSTYLIGDTQYIVIAAGGGGKLGTRHGDSIVAFALTPE